MITPTGVTSEAYWNAIKNGNRTHAKMTFTGQNIILEDEDIRLPNGIVGNDVLNSDIDLVFGKAVSKQMTTQIINEGELDKVLEFDASNVSFDAIQDATIAEIAIKFDPVQSLNGYTKPWPTGTTKNIWTGQEPGGIDTSTGQDGSYTTSYYRSKYYIPVSTGNQYVISGFSFADPSGIQVFAYDSSKNYISYFTVSITVVSGVGNVANINSLPNNTKYLRIVASNSAISESSEIQMETGNYPTSYTPCENVCDISGFTGCSVDVNGNTYNVSWSDSAGTVYSGTLDLITGVLTIDRKMWTITGTEAWSWTVTTGTGRRFRTSTSRFTGMASSGDNVSVLCDKFAWSSSTNNKWGNIRIASGYLNFCDNGSYISNVASLKEWFAKNNVKIVAPLATPIKYNLTAEQISALAQNTISVDNGKIQSVAYAIREYKLKNLNWAGEFSLEFGVEISGTTYWEQVGLFRGEKPKNLTSAEVVDFTAYDRMKMFDVLADDYVKTITYPTTLQNIYDGLCTFVGVQNVQGDELPSSMNRSFASAPMEMEGYTCRDLLSLIAEACGCYAKITNEGKCKMVWFSNHTSYALTGNEEFKIESVDATEGVPSIDQVMIKQLDSDMDILYPDNITGTNVYMIVSNPFLAVSQAQDITDYIVPIYNRLNAFGGYLPISVDCVGNWLVETGDIITVDVNGNDFVVPIFVRNFRWNGATNDSYESTGNSKREALLEKNKQKILNATEIKLIVKGKYYEKENGIVIDQNGVKVSGSKYIKLDSGGALDVQATNFIIDSINQYIKTGNWRFDGNGATFSDGTNDYVITNNSNYAPTNLRGGVYFNTSQNGGGVALHVKKSSGNTYGTLYFRTSTTDITYLYATGTRFAILGTAAYPFANAYLQYIIGRDFTMNGMPGKQLMFIFDRDYTDDSVPNRFLEIYSIQNETGGYIHFSSYGDIKFDGPIRCGTVFYDYLVQNSSREVKHDIKKLESVGDKFDKLEPVTFVYNKDPKETQRMGLIYEDTVDVMPEICNDFDGEKSINYVELIPALLKEIKDLRKRVAELENKVNGTN